MTVLLRRLLSAAIFVSAVSVPQRLPAQVELGYTLKYSSGQDVQPIFEGWSKNPDGSFAMHFGYLNRNFVEQLSIPVGPANSIEPGGPDRGQPTFFYTRINRNLFSLTVPKDWGRQEQVVWTVTAHGKTQKAIAWLQPEWEIDPIGGASGGGRNTEDAIKNRPPTITVGAVQPVTLPATLTLTADASDDGLPKPGAARKPATGQETPPILQAPTDAPVNVPTLAADAPAGRTNQRPEGLTVSWIVWRGPAGVTFDPRSVPVKDGKAVVTATFTKPGTYTLRARATDGVLSAYRTVTVTANGPAS